MLLVQCYLVKMANLGSFAVFLTSLSVNYMVEDYILIFVLPLEK